MQINIKQAILEGASYEDILEATKWKSKNLSPNNYNKIKSAGLQKSKTDLANGINKGTDNILKKYAPDTEYNPVNLNGLKTGGAMYIHKGSYDEAAAAHNNNSKTKPSEFKEDVNHPGRIYVDEKPGIISRAITPFHNVFQKNDTKNLTNAIMKRHEAYEAKQANTNPNVKGVFMKQSKINDNFLTRKVGTAGDILYVPAGNHYSANVLANEKKLLDSMKNHSESKKFSKYRQLEYDMIKDHTGVDLNEKNGYRAQKKIDNFEKNNYSGIYTKQMN